MIAALLARDMKALPRDNRGGCGRHLNPALRYKKVSESSPEENIAVLEV
jgi:hypothetical protein